VVSSLERSSTNSHVSEQTVTAAASYLRELARPFMVRVKGHPPAKEQLREVEVDPLTATGLVKVYELIA